MIKWIKRIFIAVVLAIFALALFIEFNKNSIVQKVVSGLNQNLTSPLSYKGSDVSFLSTFPSIGIKLYDLHISDDSDYALLDLGKFEVRVDLFEAFSNKDSYSIKSIHLSDGSLTAIVQVDGSTNYNIMQGSSSSEGATNVTVKSIQTDHIDIRYIDYQNSTDLNIKDLDLTGILSYIKEDINLSVDYSALTDMGVINDHLNIRGSGDIAITEDMGLISFQNLKTYLNDLFLQSNGSIKLNEEVHYDVSFNAPQSEVKELASLFNKFYENEYSSIQSEGSFSLSGQLKGSSIDEFPQYNISMSINDGQLKYPSLSQNLDQLNGNITLINTSTTSPFTNIQIDNLEIRSGDNFLTGIGSIMSKSNRYDADLDIDALLNLTELSQIIPNESNTNASGMIEGSLNIKTTLDESFGIVGGVEPLFNLDIKGTQLDFKSNGENYQVEQVSITGENESLAFGLSSDQISYIKGFTIQGSLENPLSLMSFEQSTSGKLEVKVNSLQYIQAEDTDSLTLSNNYSIPKLRLDSKLSIDELLYGSYTLSNIEGLGTLTHEQSDIEFNIDQFNGNALAGNGTLNQLLQYGLNNDTLSGSITVNSPLLNLNNYLSDDSSTEATLELIPNNIDVEISYDIGEALLYNIDVTKALGAIDISDNQIQISQQAKFFDGDITFTGTINDFDDGIGSALLDIDVVDVSLKNTAERIELMNIILPFSEFIEGTYDMTFELSTPFDSEFNPDLNSLSAFGELSTENGAINGFTPLDTFLSFINSPVNDNKWYIDNLSRYFLIEDGRVIVKKMSLKRDDLKLSYEGSHSFEQDLDYHVTLSVPKSKIKLDEVVKFLSVKGVLDDQFSSLTEDVRIEIDAYLSGKINKPKIKLTDISVSKGSIKESITEKVTQTIEQKKEEVSETIQDTLEQIKNTIQDSINTIKDDVIAQKDSIERVLTDEINDSKDEVEGQVIQIIDSLKVGNIDSLSGALNDIFKNQESKIKDIKDKIKINIFKKKKGN